MSDRDGVNDPPFFAFNQEAATEILTSTGSDVNKHKSAMQVWHAVVMHLIFRW